MAQSGNAAVTNLAQYKDRLAGLPQDRFVGSILWFSIAGTVTYTNGKRENLPVRITHDQLAKWFDELDLDPAYLPPKIKAVDAFRRATTESQREYPVDPKKGITATLMIREVTYDNEQVVRHVVKEVRDPQGQKLDYQPHMATLKFMRGGRTAKGKRPGGEAFKHSILTNVQGNDRKQVEALVENAVERYRDLSTNLHADAIRAVIRNYLTSLNAISVKPSGGVYFVHMSRQATVDSLQQLVQRIGQGCSFHQLPLLDTVDQREMLTEAFQSEVEDEVRNLLKDVAILLDKAGSNGKIPQSKYADLNVRYQAIVERSEEYTRVLGLAQGRAGSALELALDGIMDMTSRLDLGK